MLSTILTIIAAVLGSSALFTFIQFMITRRDTKEDKLDSVVEKINLMNARVDDGFVAVDLKIEALQESMEATKATTARVRILRASDEILHKMRHSKEWFDQINDDITFYETYCNEHPNFINNKAKHAIDNINAVYAKALMDGDFL